MSNLLALASFPSSLLIAYWLNNEFQLNLSGISFVVFWFLILAIFGVILSKIDKYKEGKELCPHGVAGGKTLHLCEACEEEVNAAENARQAKIAEYERGQAIRKLANEMSLQEALRLSQILAPTLDQLRSISPYQFENVIAQMFERLGFTVEQTPYSNDYGRDAIMIRNDEKYLLECKRYQEGGSSGRPELQKFHSAIISDNAKAGFFVTTGAFTKAAIEFASTQSITLVDGELLQKYLYKSLPKTTDDSYQTVCIVCGETASHSLNKPCTVNCPNGHPVEPSLTIDQVFGASHEVPPKCTQCGKTMRLVRGRRGPFWGCSQYPQCRSIQQYKGARFKAAN